MDQSNNWIGERIWFLTTMHFTRRDDVSVPRYDMRVMPQTKNTWEPDYLVFITPPGKPEERKLGLFLFGKKSLTEADANKMLRFGITRTLHNRKFLYPVGLVAFSMTNDEGFYSWLDEPRIIDGFPSLHRHTDAHSFKLDRESLDRIVDSVNAWYDALYATLNV